MSLCIVVVKSVCHVAVRPNCHWVPESACFRSRLIRFWSLCDVRATFFGRSKSFRRRL